MDRGESAVMALLTIKGMGNEEKDKKKRRKLAANTKEVGKIQRLNSASGWFDLVR